jgi:predicted hydrolase (HD superfamily)
LGGLADGNEHLQWLKGIKKRFKEKAFAAAVNRDEIMKAMQMAGVELEEIMQFIIEWQGEVK